VHPDPDAAPLPDPPSPAQMFRALLRLQPKP
jgi:hypothetical protein